MAASRLVVSLVSLVSGASLAGCSLTGNPECTVCRPGAAADRGYLFVVDRRGDAILRHDAATGELLDVFAAGGEMQVDRPSSVRLGPDAFLYLAGFGRGDVVRYDVRTGRPHDTFFADSAVLEEPVELLFRGPELIVLGHDTQNAVVIDQRGELTGHFGYPDMRAAHDFAFGPDGLLYIGTDSHPQRGTALQVWDAARRAWVRDFGELADLAAATGVAFGPDGLLYVVDTYRDQLLRFDPAGGASPAVLVGQEDELLREPVALDFGPDGALYVVDRDGVHRFDPATGAYLSWFVQAGDQLSAPRSITFVSEEAIAQRERERESAAGADRDLAD